MRFQQTAISLACATLLAACGGGGGGSGSGSGGGNLAQSISFPFPGADRVMVAVPPDIATITLKATASSGGPVTYVSNTPSTCSISGATVSLLKAGECSVNANQAGGDGYAPATARQLFVIPKRPQTITFRNPGTQPLDATPLTLVATSSVGRTLAFTSSTPTVCTVSGTALQKLANGICTVTATQDGGDIFMSATAVKNIPIGVAAPELTFLSGYKTTTLSKEDGKVDPQGGSSESDWWCSGWCEASLAADGSTISETYSFKKPLPTDGRWWMTWSQIEVFAPGVQNQPNEPIPQGVHIDAQSKVKFKLGQNQEWFTSGNNWVNVDLVTGYYHQKKNGDNCWVTLRGKVHPSTRELTDYAINLKDFTVLDGGCELTDLDPWFVLQDWSIFKIKFSSDYGNNSVPSLTAPAPNYPTTVTLGAVSFQ